MADLRWSSCLRRFGSGAAAAVAATFACVALRGEPADACGWGGPLAEDLTTFDPRVVQDVDERLFYDPFNSGWGDPCAGCAGEEMQNDWLGYLGAGIAVEDLGAILFRASAADVSAIREWLAGKRGAAIPAAYQQSSLWKDAAKRPKVKAAFELLGLAKQVEVVAGGAGEVARSASRNASGSNGASGANAKAKSKAADLVALAKAGMRATREPFLVQRYGFQLVKALFYERRWAELVEVMDKQGAALAGPSRDLAWRARYYLAGALLRSGQRARGNLELARIHAGYASLAGTAANDFRPMEETDWRHALRLATTTQDKVALWRLVGVTRDGLVALREIQKLDARSPLLALLMVREVERAEGRTVEMWGIAPDAKAEERQRREMAELEQVAMELAATAGADRPWLMTLVGGHLAARRGDLATAKTRLVQALAMRPSDERVKNQVHASLAMALVLDATSKGKAPSGRAPSSERADAIAEAMRQVTQEFGRQQTVRGEVRRRLAAANLAAGKLIEAELLVPGTLTSQPATAGKWQDVSFLKAMIARAGQTKTAFDRFLVDGSYSTQRLESELALRYLTSGAFGEASKRFASGKTWSAKLGTDPFVMRLVDCHDCDHQVHGEAPWTHESFAARLVELERVAKGKGEAAAKASLELGNALYNITWYGNARVVLAETHQKQRETKAAERWYKRAYELSRDRELRVKAAFFAAKAELGGLITAAEDAAGMSDGTLGLSDLPVPRRWFPVVESLADTRYYEEILAECGHFRRWQAAPPR